jgi:hypothetical protein
VSRSGEFQRASSPFTVLRRLDAVLTPKKADFLATAQKVAGMECADTALESIARTTYGHTFYNTGPLDFKKLTDDADNVAGMQIPLSLDVLPLGAAYDPLRGLMEKPFGWHSADEYEQYFRNIMVSDQEGSGRLESQEGLRPCRRVPSHRK